MNKREKQKAETLAEIIKSAEELFFSQGYERTSVNQIVKACGITKGAFYHHFRSKEEVLEKMFHDHYESIIQAVEVFRNDQNISWLERIKRISAASRELGIARVDLVKEIMSIQNDFGNLILKEKMSEYDKKMYIELIAPILQEAKEAGDCKFTVSPRILAIFIHRLDNSVTKEINTIFRDLPAEEAGAAIDEVLDGFAFSLERLLGLDHRTVLEFLQLEEAKAFYKQILNKEK